MENESISMKEMCEVVSRDAAKQGLNISPEQIFNYSPTGELTLIFFAYAVAIKVESGVPRKQATLKVQQEWVKPLVDYNFGEGSFDSAKGQS